MRRFFAGLGLILLAAAIAAPVRAEILAPSRHEQDIRPSHEFAAKSRPRVTIYPRYPGRNAKRICRSWLVAEYRISGPVIVPQMRCWWN